MLRRCGFLLLERKKNYFTKTRKKFLASYLITYIKKDIAQDFDIESIIDVFYVMKERQAQLQMPKFS